MKKLLTVVILVPALAFVLSMGCALTDDDDPIAQVIPTVLTAPSNGQTINTVASMVAMEMIVPPPNDELQWTGAAENYTVEVFDTAQPGRPRWSSAPMTGTTLDINDISLYSDATTIRDINDYITMFGDTTVEWRVIGSNGQTSDSWQFTLDNS